MEFLADLAQDLADEGIQIVSQGQVEAAVLGPTGELLARLSDDGKMVWLRFATTCPPHVAAVITVMSNLHVPTSIDGTVLLKPERYALDTLH